jgi:flagellin
MSMAQVINSNVATLTAQRNATRVQNDLSTAINRLSSGLRINSAKDDAAGLAISDRFTSQIRGINVAARNANDGISLAQTAEGAMGSVSDMLQRVRELAVQSANASNSASDRKALQQEVSQLVSELGRVADATEFNGVKLLDGTMGTQSYQVGANAGQTIVAGSANLRTTVYGNNQVKSNGGAAVNTDANSTTGGTIAVNGSSGSSTITVTAGDSAKTIAAAINAAKGTTNVGASAVSNAQLEFGATGSYALTLTSDNSTAVNVSFNYSGASADGLSGAIAAFNEQTAKTGVTAKLNDAGTGLVLTNASGADILVKDTATANAGAVTVTKLESDAKTTSGAAVTLAADTNADSAAVSGTLSLDSDKSFGVVVTDTNAAASDTSDLLAVSTLDVSTIAGSTDALKIVDAALSFVSSERAKLGALQSRFESTINNLSTASENLSASRSRIQDADFAKETASLSRAQVLQQASTAMIAQANSMPSQVLSLLR